MSTEETPSVESRLSDLFDEQNAPSDRLWAAFEQAVRLLNFIFGDGITYRVLGSATRGTAILGPGLDIDLDMIFPSNSEWRGFSYPDFEAWVRNVVGKIIHSGVAIVGDRSEVTRSFTIKVHGIDIEIFPKFREYTNPNKVVSFNHSRFAVTNDVLRLDYRQPEFVSTQIGPPNLRKAIFALKFWKDVTGNKALFKSYHLLLIANAAIDVNPHGFFDVPSLEDTTWTIKQWVVALWRRIAAVRLGKAKFVVNDVHISETEYASKLAVFPCPIEINGIVITCFELWAASIDSPKITFRVLQEV